MAQPGRLLSLLKSRLTAGTGTYIIKIDGIYAATSGLIPQTLVRVVNGQVQAIRSASGVHNPDAVFLPIGAVVQLVDLETVNQPTLDVLRIRFTVNNGGRGAVAFLLPKGSLMGMSEKVMESLVGAVLEPNDQAPIMPRVMAKDKAATSRSQPPLWRISPVQYDNQKGMKALLIGTANVGGQTQPALLTVSCTKGVSPDAYPPFAASADVQVRPELVTFDTGYMEDKSAFHDNAGRSQLGTLPEIHIDIDAQNTDKGVRVFGLSYDEPDLKDMIWAAGSALKVTLMPETAEKGSPLIAQFHLPADGAGVQSMMSSCFESLETKERKERAKDVVSCPVVQNKVLKDMKVLVGPAGKELETDPDSDQIKNWVLPIATKAKAPLKLVLACFYGEPGYRRDPKEVLEKRVLPIPATATGCVIAQDSTENRNHGECTRP